MYMILNYYELIFTFSLKVYRRSNRMPPSSTIVTDLFKRWYGSGDLKDAMSPNTDFDDLRKVKNLSAS